PARPFGNQPERLVALDRGEDLLPLRKREAATAGWGGDVGRNNSASLTEPVPPRVLVEAQRHRGPLLGQAGPHQQPELPLQLPSSRYITAHETPSWGLGCCVHSLNRRRGRGGAPRLEPESIRRRAGQSGRRCAR